MAISRNGRVKVYANETPWETDVLYSNMYNMMNAAYLAMATLGVGNSNATLVAGIPVTQNTVPDLSVLIGAGVMFNFQQLDATDYSSIPADTATTDKIYKPYIQYTQFNSADNTARGNLIGLPLVFTPPGSGTTNYLLQAKFLTVDTDSENREFFNEADPDNPIVQNVTQTRWDTIQYSLVAATSPAIPTPTDNTWVGLYVIAIASGASTITNGNISVYSGAPFITENLTQKVSYASLQASTPIYGLDTGATNAYTVTATPAYTAIGGGSRVSMKAVNANTGAATLNVSALGAVAIRVSTPLGLQPLRGNEILANQIYEFRNDGTFWELLNPSVSTRIAASVYRSTNQLFNAAATVTVQFDQSDFDPFSMFDFTNFWFLLPLSGKWRVNSSVQIPTTGGSPGGFTVVLANANPSPVNLSLMGNIISSTADTANTGVVIVQATAGDKLYIAATNGSANNINIIPGIGQLSTFFQIEYLGN